MRSDVHPQAHHPAPLGDLTVAGEAELLEQGLRAGVEVRAALRVAALDLLGVGLDEPATGRPDGVQRAGDRSPGDTLAAVPLAGEDAADPPVRQLDELLGVAPSGS